MCSVTLVNLAKSFEAFQRDVDKRTYVDKAQLAPFFRSVDCNFTVTEIRLHCLIGKYQSWD
jgi:hypothetical protein